MLEPPKNAESTASSRNRGLIMVCISAGADNTRLLATGKRLADSTQRGWLAVNVETPRSRRLPESRRSAATQALALAENAGAQIATLYGGSRFGKAVLEYARAHDVVTIVVGKPRGEFRRYRLFGSVIETMIAASGDLDIHVVGSEKKPQDDLASGKRLHPGSDHAPDLNAAPRWRGYAEALAVAIACTLIAWPLSFHLQLPNVLMIYLLGVLFVSIRHDYGPSVTAVVLGIAAFDFFYVLPSLAFALPDSMYIVTFVVVLIVALVVSNRSMNMRRRTREARNRESQTAALYALSRTLAGVQAPAALLKRAERDLSNAFDADIEILASGQDDFPSPPPHSEGPPASQRRDKPIIRWVYDHARLAGLGTSQFPESRTLYLPLRGLNNPVGVLAVTPRNPSVEPLRNQQRLLNAFAIQIGLAFDRARLAREATQAQLSVEAERLRNSLLSSVSHDLRTPLATIVGASSSLIEDAGKASPESRRALAGDILEAARRMTRLVNNVLEITRLQSGAVAFNRQWFPLEEIVGSVLTRLGDQLEDHPVSVTLPQTLPWLFVDGGMTEQVLINLVENAIKYTPADTPIEIGADHEGEAVVVEVADRGPGLPPEAYGRIFDKFYRAPGTEAPGGAGLGLAICRAIVAGQGGRIWAESRPGGGRASNSRWAPTPAFDRQGKNSDG